MKPSKDIADKITLRCLRYFVALAEEMSFNRTAKRLQVSPATVTLNIQKLESVLETRLFERSTAQVRLTLVGGVFLGGARAVFERLEQALNVIKKTTKAERV